MFNNKKDKDEEREFYKSYRLKDKKILRVVSFIIVPFLALSFRYGYITIAKSEELKSKGNRQYSYVENIESLTYKVFDSEGNEFFSSNNKYTVAIDPISYEKFNTDMEAENIKKLKYILRNYNKDYVLPDEIKNKKPEELWGKLYYEVDKDTYNKIKDIEGLDYIKGVYAYEGRETEKIINWDIVNLITNPINPVDSTEKPKESLEGIVKNKTKENTIPKVVFEKDITGNLLPERYIKGEENKNLKLTLNKELQEGIHKMLQGEEYEKYDEIGVVLMESDTGKVRALTQRDYSKPNVNIGAASNHGYFPGSIFKVLVEEIAIETGVAWPNKIYERDKTIKEFNNKDSLSVHDAFIWSSNDIFYQIGEEVGFDNIFKIAEQHGLLDTVLNLYNEEEGSFEVDKENLTRDQVRHSAIGQKIRITPLGAISIPNTVINQGIYVKPQIIEGYVDNEGNILEEYEVEEKRIIKKSTADSLKENMIDLINSKIGTGNNAKVPEALVGGKTGTTEYFEVNDKGEREKFSDGWFVGFFEHEGVNYSMVVFVKNINCKGDYPEEGGTTAAPVFKKVVELIKEKNFFNNN